MPTSDLLWTKTRAEAVATDLLQFAVFQSLRLPVPEIAARMRITVGLAERYERTLADLLNAEAVPADTGTAPYKTHDNSEGVTTP